MNICLFGGTFDPVHLGHVAIAKTAADRFALKQVLFCPAAVSPFKVDQRTAPYVHRFAMVALATRDDARFLVSDLESPDQESSGPNYTIDTVRMLQSRLGKSDHLYFLCGADAFLHIAKWKEPEALLSACEFIVAARPGYPLADLAAALPESMRPSKQVLKASRSIPSDSLVLPGANIHLISDTDEPASSTRIRKSKKTTQLDPVISAYIKKHKLYSVSGAKQVNSKKRTE